MRISQPVAQLGFEIPDDAILMPAVGPGNRSAYANAAFVALSGFSDAFEVWIRKTVLFPCMQSQLDVLKMKGGSHLLHETTFKGTARWISEIDSSQRTAIRASVRLEEIRAPGLGNHILRTQAYVRLIAIDFRLHPKYRRVMTNKCIAPLLKNVNRA